MEETPMAKFTVVGLLYLAGIILVSGSARADTPIGGGGSGSPEEAEPDRNSVYCTTSRYGCIAANGGCVSPLICRKNNEQGAGLWDCACQAKD
jgi:hypothetical protein